MGIAVRYCYSYWSWADELFLYLGIKFQASWKDGMVSISMAEATSNSWPTPQELHMIKRW